MLAGARLDVAAARLFPEFSRARLQSWIEEGTLRLNGVPAKRVRALVSLGDRLELGVPPPAAADDAVAAQSIPLDVVWFDASVAVINKPAGLTVHPGAGIRDGTLQNALLHRFPQTAEVPRAGLVHRLDKETSGLLVVALTLSAHIALLRAMQRHEIEREYLALVRGRIHAPGQVDAPIGRDPHHRQRMAVVTGGRKAVTHYAVEQSYGHFTLLRVRLETGRTHQIRVHLSHRRHPLVGDPVYGGQQALPRSMTASLAEELSAFRRQALHARRLAFKHPLTGESLALQAAVPDDLRHLLDALAKGDPV